MALDHTAKYILKGREVVEVHDLLEWAEMFESMDRIIAKTIDERGVVEVSTVFLGLDHRFTEQQAPLPLVFETMVFGGEHHGEQDRYCTYDQAKAGHQAMCDRVWALDAEIIEDGRNTVGT